MKQYITGFITASCLVTSFFLFVAAQNTEFGDIKVHSISIVNNEGKETIWLGSGEGGNGFLETFNNDGFRTSNLGSSVGDYGSLSLFGSEEKPSSFLSDYLITYNSKQEQTTFCQLSET